MRRRRRFVAFNVVGALGVVVQMSTVALLTRVVHVHYALATSASVALTVVHNFVWHRRWTWRDRAGGTAPTFARFALANGVVSLAGNLGVVAALVSGAHVPPAPANLVAIGVCGVVNFWIGDAAVFAVRMSSADSTSRNARSCPVCPSRPMSRTPSSPAADRQVFPSTRPRPRRSESA